MLLDLGGAAGLDSRAVGRSGPAGARRSYEGAWELPGIGAVSAPTGVLIRPDGYVAWVGEGGADGLADALGAWFGPATSLNDDEPPRGRLV